MTKGTPMPTWTPGTWLQLATFVMATVATIFGAGVQWAKTTQVEASQKAFEEAVKADYLRADVYAADQRRLSEAIDRLTKALEPHAAEVGRQLRYQDDALPKFGPQ